MNAPFEEVEGWINTHGFHAVNNYSKYAAMKGDRVRNPRAWVQRALEDEYILKDWRMQEHRLDNSAGRYADFIHC